jgi:hypothetical protein
MQNRIASPERTFDRGGVGNITDGGLDAVDTERLERGGDPVR